MTRPAASSPAKRTTDAEDSFMDIDKITGTDVPVEKGIESLGELEVCQVVRSEFMSPTFRPKLTFNIDSISFNSSCVRLFNRVEYVQLLINVNKKQLIVLPCEKTTKDSLKWCTLKGEKVVPRKNSCRIFGAKLYELMGWIPDNRYKVQAVYQKIGDVELLVFNLEECEMIVPQYSENADGKRVRKVRRYYPEAWKESFGMTYREHKQSIDVDIDAHYMLHKARDGGESAFAHTQREIRGEALKPSEIITRQYNTPDSSSLSEAVRI